MSADLAERLTDHCGTGNTATPRFPEPERMDWERGYAAHLVVLCCMDCGTELVRYTQLRPLVKPRSRLNWRRDPNTWRDIGPNTYPNPRSNTA